MQILRHLLWPVALVYGVVISLRGWLYDNGFLRSEKFNLPVICIGNLEMGGTGKSPLVIHVCAQLAEQGHRVVLLSRGYGRAGNGFRWVNDTDSANEVGDEPLQARLRLIDKVKVAVCAIRVSGIRSILSEDPFTDVIVLDDAFQHRQVHPSLSILTTPSERPFWQNRLLPLGSLRDLPSAAFRAQALILIGNESSESRMPFKGRVFTAQLKAGDLVHFSGKKVLCSEGDCVLLFSGIARSERFHAMAAERFKVLMHRSFGDHHVFSINETRALRQQFLSFGSDVKAIVTTEKDAARLRNSKALLELGEIPVFFLPIGFLTNESLQNIDYFISEHVEQYKRDS